MKRYHKRTVQLTSLLDLLFIMVFIALMMEPPKEIPTTEPVSDISICENKVSSLEGAVANCNAKTAAMAEEISKLKKELSNQAVDVRSNSDGVFRKLFFVNMYKLQRNKYVFFGSTLIVGDEKMGTAYMFTLRQANNSAYRPKKLSPVGEAEAGDFQICTNVIISRDRLSQDCLAYGRVHRWHDCKRTDRNTYICDATGTDKTTNKKWSYKMKYELLKIYDPNLEW